MSCSLMVGRNAVAELFGECVKGQCFDLDNGRKRIVLKFLAIYLSTAGTGE